MIDTDLIYYARRAEQQRRAAAAAQNDEVRRRHLDLAQLLDAHQGQIAR